MKHRIPFCYLYVLALVIHWGTNQASAQHSGPQWFAEAWTLPLLASIGNHGLKDYGSGYYDFSLRRSVTQEYGLLVGRRFGTNWEAGLGFSQKSLHQRLSYTLTLDNAVPFFERQLNFYYSFWGIRAFGGYRWGPHGLRFTLELNDKYRSYNDFKTPMYTILSQNFTEPSVTTFEERKGLDRTSAFAYLIPEITYSFQVHKYVALLGGVKWKFYGKTGEDYIMTITRERQQVIGPPLLLNDIRLYDRFLMLYIGANVGISWEKLN